MPFEFWVDIYDSSGTKRGSGPLNVTEWRTVSRMDKAGEFSFRLPLTDPQSNLIQPLRVAKAYAIVDGAVQILGIGVIESIETDLNSEPSMMTVSGNDITHNLAFMSMGFQTFNAVTFDAALSTLFAASSPWTHTLDAAGVGVGSLYYETAGESTLQTLRTLCKGIAGGAHFYFDPNGGSNEEHIHISVGVTSSGVRATQSPNPADYPELCGIKTLKLTHEAFDLITRIYPYGAGNGDQRLTLEHTTATAPFGYSLNATENYIQNDISQAALGTRIKHLAFNDIRPISNSAQAMADAADALFVVAYNELKNRSSYQRTYQLEVVGLSKLLKPSQTIRVVYEEYAGAYKAMSVDEDLVILEVTTVVDETGIRTDSLVVSNLDKYPTDDFSAIVQEMEAGRSLEAHPQLTATKDRVGPYTRRIDATHNAVFTFDIGDETTTLTYANLRVKTQPLRSSVKSNEAESSHTHTVSIGASGAHVHDISHQHDIYVLDDTQAPLFPAVHMHTVAPAEHFIYDGGGTGGTKSISTDAISLSTSASANHTHPATATSSGSAHSHGVTYGIYQDTVYPSDVTIWIDGVDRTLALTGAATIPGGTAISDTYPITQYLEDQSTLRGTHTIEFRCASGQGEVEAEVIMLMSVQAIAI